VSPPIIFACVLAGLCLAGGNAYADAKGELRFQQGVAAFGAKEFGAAREAFQSFLSRNPEDATALRYLGLISRAEGNDQQAIEFFRKALDLEPTDVLTYVALAESLLKAEQNIPAQDLLRTALALAPTHARLHLYRGIAEYRLRDLDEAIRHLERASALDPNMEREARYYIGLCQAILGNLYTAARAFTEVAEGSPAHPLGRSARNLREAMEPETPEQRWNVNATTGIEFDTNPLVVGDGNEEDAESDVAGSFGVRALVDAYRGQGVTVRAGYDGFFLKHIDLDEIDEQTHIARGVVLYDLRNVRLALRYDGAFTALEFGDPLRIINTIEPSVSVRVGRLGITQAFYQLHRFDYFDTPDEKDFNLDGFQHNVGIAQMIIPRHPMTHVRIGADALLRDTRGKEFDSFGASANLGAGVLLPWFDMELSGLYRFTYLKYRNKSQIDADGDPDERIATNHIARAENVHEITANVNVPLWRRLSLDVAGAFTFYDSESEFFTYNRQIVGAYLTWDFGEKPKPRRRPRPILQEPQREEGKFPGE
jgi:tetratricopeptide (TPR) repeat protein